jgi:LPXTG-site transpeptidase (sortase) family protein
MRRSSHGTSEQHMGHRSRNLAAAAALCLVVVASGALAVVLSGSVGGAVPPSPMPSATAGGAARGTNSPSQRQTPSRTPAPTSDATPGAGVVATRIRIVRLSIDLPIVEGDGIDAPMKKAAHYPDTAWPGGGSNIYIYGHAQKGMFLTLWNVAIGDKVALDLVDGTTRTYTVTKIIPKAPWDAMELLDPTPTEQLTLQTSTSYLPTSPRFVVIAVPTAAG